MPLRWSDAELAVAAGVSRQRRMLVASDPAERPGVETVPTVEFDMSSVVIVVPDDGSHIARRASPRCGCSEKSRPFARMASSQGWPGRAFSVSVPGDVPVSAARRGVLLVSKQVSEVSDCLSRTYRM